MKRIKLSAFLVVRNEEKNIERALKSLDFCDEIILVDQESTDNTLKIAKKYTKKIYHDKCRGHCEPSRLLALKKCKGDWILNIDADERISSPLKKEIIQEIEKNHIEAFYIHRNLYFMGKLLKNLGSRDFILRLHKKNEVIYSSEMHSSPIKKKTAKVKKLNNSIEHANVSYKQTLKKIKYFAKTQANVQKKNKTKLRKYLGIFYVPLFYFFYNYIYNKGILDGKEGLIYSLLSAYYEFEIQKNAWLRK